MRCTSKLIASIVIVITLTFQIQAQNARKFKLPAARTPHEKELMMQNIPKADPFVYSKGGISMPANVRYPGEFEESQAVVISWAPDLIYDNNTNTWIAIGVDTFSVYAYISAQCAKYLSDELPVWIRVPFAKDTLPVKNMMNLLGWPLNNNYKFFVFPSNDWWIRDFGPNGIYYGSKDSIGFVDLKYYQGRDRDNQFPGYLAQAIGHKNFESKMNGEGGNLMSDGFGKVFFSSVFTYDNAQTYNHIPAWSSQQTLDTIKNLFNATEAVNLKSLQCDGGTGHIDLYVKLMDEQTLFVAKYPDTVTAPDKQIVEDNFQYMTTLKSTYNRPFRIYRIPDPTRDDGKYNTTCDSLNFDARTFINGITANKLFLYPSYSDDIDGNKAQTDQVTALYKKLLPGYKVIPIDSRDLTGHGGGGAIHCITMQIPTENPVLFWHPSVDGKQPIQSKYHIISKITNSSGIKGAWCYWRKKGDGPYYRQLNLTDSAGYFVGDIEPGTLTTQDWIVYFLSAYTNNGRGAVKPITAPEGYYQMYFTDSTDGLTLGSGTIEKIEAKNHLFGAYPNPASNTFTIPFNLTENASVNLVITDITGRELLRISKQDLPAGFYKEEFNTDALNNGIYFYSMYMNGQKLSTRKLVIQR